MKDDSILGMLDFGEMLKQAYRFAVRDKAVDEILILFAELPKPFDEEAKTHFFESVKEIFRKYGLLEL